MSEDYDFDPGVWKGHDFKSARATFDVHAGRSYADATTAGKTADDYVPEQIRTESFNPLILMVDVTGSMGSWPATMFEKLPYLEIEAKTYLGPDMEISFCAVGDATCDKYPLQVSVFAKGTDLKVELGKLVVEGKGGGQDTETYELGALYAAHNVIMPNAVKPIFIFIADEQPYPRVTRNGAFVHAKVKIEKDLSVDEIFAQLKAKYSVYLIHKPYNDSGKTRREWVRLIGEDHIADLQDPARVVDVIFGILATETGRIDYFHKEIEDRQAINTADGKKKIDTVYRALHTIHLAAGDPAAGDPALLVKSDKDKRGGKSTMHHPSTGKPSRGLL